MSENGNGTNHQNEQWSSSLISFRTMSGVLCHIRPLNIATLKAIRLKAADVYPYPTGEEKELYRLPIENAADPSIKDNAENNPAYQAIVSDINEQRSEFENKAILALAVTFPDFPTPQSLIEHFATQLMAMRKYAVLPDNDYEATLDYCVFTGNQVQVKRDAQTGGIVSLTAHGSDFVKVKELALQYTPLTHMEVVNGIRFFRTEVP